MPVDHKNPVKKRNHPIWKPVVYCDDCEACDCCGEPICPHCDMHYADCPCPGPMQEDEFEYKTLNGYEYARPIGEDD